MGGEWGWRVWGKKQEGDEEAMAEGRTSSMQPVSDNQRNDGEGGGLDREERAEGESITGVAVLMTEPPSEGM